MLIEREHFEGIQRDPVIVVSICLPSSIQCRLNPSVPRSQESYVMYIHVLLESEIIPL